MAGLYKGKVKLIVGMFGRPVLKNGQPVIENGKKKYDKLRGLTLTKGKDKDEEAFEAEAFTHEHGEALYKMYLKGEPVDLAFRRDFDKKGERVYRIHYGNFSKPQIVVSNPDSKDTRPGRKSTAISLEDLLKLKK